MTLLAASSSGRKGVWEEREGGREERGYSSGTPALR